MELQRVDRAAITTLATQFAVDAHELIRLGVRVDQGTTFAAGAGLGAAGLAAFQGHWMLALGAALIGAVAGGAAQEFKRTRFESMRAKWTGVLAGLNQEELRAFALEIDGRYPSLMPALKEDVLGGYSIRRLLT